ncbi:P-loop containing nucleoside triphosphate hydrolase protein [Geopyxis carbonaria]|nr:P-loop containing nucleoside triphosphate hydrolase protein [Geopyxis carbonaria]
MNQALQDLSIGKQPEMTPTMEDIIKAKKRVQYNNENFHFAICGTAGSGKSSMINAIRGVTPKHPQAAKTGVTETTMDIGRYPDPSKEPPRSRFVWYDIPGAGTQKIKGWQYFNNQGLYVFDFVIVLVDNRFTELEVEILKNCHRMGIPCFIVRSKADQHIANIEKEQAMDEEDYEEDYEDIGEDPHKCTQPTAREQYIAQTRESIAKNLEEAGLPPQYVYLISNRALLRAMPKGKMDAAKNLISNFTTSSDAIDEDKMVRDMINTARARRYREAISVG